MINYERILEAIREEVNDPEMDLDLSEAQIETLAEIATDEANNIIREAKEAIVIQLQDALDLIGDQL